MTAADAATHPALTRTEVEEFLYLEARLADENDYDAWEALWTDDAVYWVPAGRADADPHTSVSVIFDNRRRISTRLSQLRTGKRYAQAPASSMRRLISNIEIIGPAGRRGHRGRGELPGARVAAARPADVGRPDHLPAPPGRRGAAAGVQESRAGEPG